MTMTIIEEEILQRHLELLRSVNKLDADITDDFLETIVKQVSGTKNLIESIFADTGGGKSYCGIKQMEVIEKEVYHRDWTHTHIRFDDIGMQQLLKTLPDENTVVRDEQESELGEGSAILQQKTNTLDKTIRIKKINIFRCSPVLRSNVHHFVLKIFQSKHVKSHPFHYKGRTLHAGLEGSNFAIVWKPDETRLWGLDDRDIVGWVELPCPKNLKELVAYEKANYDFKEMLQSGRQTGINKLLRDYANDFIKDNLKTFGIVKKKKELRTLISEYMDSKESMSIGMKDSICDMVIMEMRKKKAKYPWAK